MSDTEKCAACGAAVTFGQPYEYTLWVRQPDGKATPSETKGVRQSVACHDCKSKYVVEGGLPYWWDDQQGRFVPRDQLKGNELMPKATQEQLEQVKELRSRGAQLADIARKAGVKSQDLQNWIRKGVAADRADKLTKALEDLLLEIPDVPAGVPDIPANVLGDPRFTAKYAPDLVPSKIFEKIGEEASRGFEAIRQGIGSIAQVENLDWTTNGLKVFKDQLDTEPDFWKIGRRVEQLWMEAEDQLKLLPPEEAETLRQIVRRRVTK